MEELDEIIKQINDEFGEGTITTADKIDPPENPYRDFMDRNPQNKADGGMLVKPSADGRRPGYQGKKPFEKVTIDGKVYKKNPDTGLILWSTCVKHVQDIQTTYTVIIWVQLNLFPQQYQTIPNI